jgi:hypothetical protein
VIVVETPPDAVAVSTFSPAIVPSVQRVRATPFSSVGTVTGSTEPPLFALKVVTAPASGWSSLPYTTTATGSGSALPAGPVRFAVEGACMRAAGSGALMPVSPQDERPATAIAAKRTMTGMCCRDRALVRID